MMEVEPTAWSPEVADTATKSRSRSIRYSCTIDMLPWNFHRPLYIVLLCSYFPVPVLSPTGKLVIFEKVLR